MGKRNWRKALTGAVLALSVAIPLPSRAEGPDLKVFGLVIGEPMPVLPYCDMLNSYLADERQPALCNLQSWSVTSPVNKPWGARQYTLYLPSAERPPYLRHDEEFGDLNVFTQDDKVVSVSFATVGEKAMAQAYVSLAKKYGKATRYEKLPMTTLNGKAASGIQAAWEFPNLLIRLSGIRRDKEWGRVEFLTPAYRSHFEAWQKEEGLAAPAVR